jgi:hypothetical protein
MKKYIKILAIATFLLLFVAISIAQNSTNVAPSVQPRKTVEVKTSNLVGEMTKVAALTPDEISKITPIVSEFQKQKRADKVSFKGNKEKLAAARKLRIDNLSSQLKVIVTPDQYTKLQDHWKNKTNRVPTAQSTKKA